MYVINKLLAIIIALSPLGTATAYSDDPCDNADTISHEARVVIQGSALDKDSFLVGTFQLQNLSKKRNFVIRGTPDASASTFHIMRPDISVEYLDLLNRWQRMLELPGSFYGKRESHVASPGKSIVFTTWLFSADIASKNAREFRLLIRTQDPSLCLVSVPFRGFPLRPKVVRLESVETVD